MSMKQPLGRSLEGVAAIFVLFCIAVLIRSWVGLGLQLFELLEGERDYSGWLIMSAAEEPTAQLLLQFGHSVVGIALGIFTMMVAETWRTTRQPPKPLAAIRRWRSAFDKEAGSDAYLWAACFLGLHLTGLVRPAVDLLLGEALFIQPFGAFMLDVLRHCVLAVVLVRLSYLSKRDWDLVLMWAGIFVLVGICWIFLFITFETEELRPLHGPFDWAFIRRSFVLGFFQMAGLVYAVRLGGLKWRTLALGCVLSYVLRWPAAFVASGLALSMLSFEQLAAAALSGALFGSLVYAGFYMRFASRKSAIVQTASTTVL